MKLNWKTLPVTSFATAEEILKALECSGLVVGWKAGQLIKKMEGNIKTPSGPVNVSIVDNADLGVSEKIAVPDFYRLAVVAGHKLCTPEIGILARLAYTPAEQSEDSNLWFIAIAMEPVEVNGELLILRIAVGTQGARLDAVQVNDEKPFTSDPSDKWLVVSE